MHAFAGRARNVKSFVYPLICSIISSKLHSCFIFRKKKDQFISLQLPTLQSAHEYKSISKQTQPRGSTGFFSAPHFLNKPPFISPGKTTNREKHQQNSFIFIVFNILETSAGHVIQYLFRTHPLQQSTSSCNKLAFTCSHVSPNDNGLSTQVPYDVPSRCSVAEHKLRVTAFCALRNILRHTGSVMEHRDGIHHSLHDICSVFTSRCTSFRMPHPASRFSQIQEVHSFHVFISGMVMLPWKTYPFFVVSTGTGHLSVCGRAKKQDLFLF